MPEDCPLYFADALQMCRFEALTAQTLAGGPPTLAQAARLVPAGHAAPEQAARAFLAIIVAEAARRAKEARPATPPPARRPTPRPTPPPRQPPKPATPPPRQPSQRPGAAPPRKPRLVGPQF